MPEAGLSDLVISVDDPRNPDVRDLLDRHLEFARTWTPPEGVHALPADELTDPAITLFSARIQGQLVAIGALKQLDDRHGELKSMHTAATVRGRGLGMAMVRHLIAVARDRGLTQISLETGTMDAFAPARSLYGKAGFNSSGPFGDYRESSTSTFMTLILPSGDDLDFSGI